MDGHAVQTLCLADHAEDDVGQLGRGSEEEPALDGAGSDLDEGICGHETERSGHAWFFRQLGGPVVH